ncbi:MAG: hypothetical protein ACI9OJ_004796, partial [Myxococcota bacterium]
MQVQRITEAWEATPTAADDRNHIGVSRNLCAEPVADSSTARWLNMGSSGFLPRYLVASAVAIAGFVLPAAIGLADAHAQSCPADDGVACDSSADDDECLDGTFVCVGAVGTCREGPVIFLPFDEGTGVSALNAADLPDVADPVVGAGVQVEPGYPSAAGGSLAFPGNDTSAFVRLDVGEAIESNFTWSFWVNPAVATNTFVFSRTTSASINGFSYSTDGTVYLDGAPLASSPLATGSFTYVTITFDGMFLKVYHDGSLDADVGATATLAWISDVWIGQKQGIHNGSFNAPSAFNGTLDELTYHSYALNSGEVSNLFATGVPFGQKNRELCDGFDNDCRAATIDPQGQPCDGLDADQCMNGTGSCAAGGLVVECTNETVENIPEVCNFLDDDCNGVPDDGIGVGDSCDGADPDACEGGRNACGGAGVICGTEPVLSLDFEVLDGKHHVIDRSSFNQTAQLQGTAQVVAGHVGDGLGLSGGGDRLAVFQSGPLSGAFGAITVSMWVNPQSTTSGRLFEKLGYLVVDVVNGAVGVTRDGTAPSVTHGSLAANTWSHILVTRKGDVVLIYIDGTLVGNDSRPEGVADTPASRAPLRIGGGFIGTIDDVAVFDRPLNQAEVAELHAEPHYFTVSNEICGELPADANCDGVDNQPKSMGCTVHYLDSDTDGAGAQTILDMQPAAYWPMDELNGAGEYIDWSGNGTNLPGVTTGEGVTRRVAGQVGLALDLNSGESQSNCIPNVFGTRLQLTNGVTYAAWINPHGFLSGTTMITGGGPNQRFGLSNSGRLTFQGSGLTVGSNSTVSLNMWTHVAVSFDEATVSFYINGVLDVTKGHSVQGSATSVCLGS